MTHRYLAARQAVLASGVPIAPGEPISAKAVDIGDPHDQHLLHDGLLIDVTHTDQERDK